ncbi:hypothetical protein [Methylobacterium sp. ID0610]|uniref:hypothetical protein n=1 Tax=Methylobacterium carpenticola TaxID=3344827 RepID=UPI0036ABA9D6
MSCRHHSAAVSDAQILSVPSAVWKWRRWPQRLPVPANDNRLPATGLPGLRAAGEALLRVTMMVLGLAL